MKRLLLGVTLTLVLSLSLPRARIAQAQEGGPTAEPTPAGQRAGVVTGQLANGTAGGMLPGNLEMMLHAWDDAGETVMLDGTVDANGAFRFDDVPMQDGWTFAAMVGYNDVTFFSDYVPVMPGLSEVTLPLTVYETTADASAVTVAQLHTFLEFVVGEVSVSEVYVLSNLGDRAVTGAITLPDGRAASLQFAPPAGANKVSFKGNDSSARFVMTADGFADIAPLVPGESASQVLVTYSLPYQDGMTVAHNLPYPVDGMNVLHRADAGVTVSAPSLSAPTQQGMGQGQRYAIYEGAAQPAGGRLDLTLAGQPNYLAGTEDGSAAAPATLPVSDTARLLEQYALPVSGGLLGLALVAAGAWWLRRNRPAALDAEAEADVDGAPESAADGWDGLLRQIAALDDAHARGEVAEADYAGRRADLKARARAILQAEQAQ